MHYYILINAFLLARGLCSLSVLLVLACICLHFGKLAPLKYAQLAISISSLHCCHNNATQGHHYLITRNLKQDCLTGSSGTWKVFSSRISLQIHVYP